MSPLGSMSVERLEELVRTRESAHRLAWVEYQAAQAAWIRSKNMLSARKDEEARLEVKA